MDLSIIIVSYNASAHLERCLESLRANPPAVPHEIIVVDNHSSDDSADVAARFAAVRVIRSDTNRGFAAANNLGIRASSGAHLLLLNNDTVVPQGAIDGLVERLAREPDVAVIGPRLVDGAGRAELSFGAMISPLAEWRQARLAWSLANNEPEAVATVEAMTRREQRPDWVTGACMLVRRSDAEAVGLLDERFFMYTEDVDFCASLRARGRQILFLPSVEVVHLRGRSAATAFAATRQAYEQSHLRFYQKHQPVYVPLLLLFRLARRLIVRVPGRQ
ncbi:MAG TPA: glycosyltransferase family 2 protein [Vicinamibacterales bacterium]|nr:glycosyltransferase family 2 protein [Vicinamibacterales bacterium]